MAKETKEKKNVKNEKSKKELKTKKTPKVKKESLAKGVKKELKLVKWPDANEMVKNTIATIVFCIVFVAFFELLNVVMAFIKGSF